MPKSMSIAVTGILFAIAGLILLLPDEPGGVTAKGDPCREYRHQLQAADLNRPQAELAILVEDLMAQPQECAHGALAPCHAPNPRWEACREALGKAKNALAKTTAQ